MLELKMLYEKQRGLIGHSVCKWKKLLPSNRSRFGGKADMGQVTKNVENDPTRHFCGITALI
jgi:hypothetical protein